MARLIFTLPTKVLAFAFLCVAPGSGSLRSARREQRHRKLAGFVISFQITWRFEISDQEGVPEDREPTEIEYQGINQATVNFFTTEIPAVYADETAFTFRAVGCTTESTDFSPGSVEWQHQMTIQCEPTFDADSIDNIPPAETFLTDMNQDYLLDNFVRNHLRSVEPSLPPSIFRFSDRVGYNTSLTGTSGPAPIDSAPTPTIVVPAPTITTPAPVFMTPAPIITTPAPSTIIQAPTLSPITLAPAPMAPAPTIVAGLTIPQQKVAPPAKCGSLALELGRGGAAAAAKACTSRLRRTRKLKGSN
jgi:hypothetical protein